jgi:nucleoside-diphosphate-sugar epimerase
VLSGGSGFLGRQLALTLETLGHTVFNIENNKETKSALINSTFADDLVGKVVDFQPKTIVHLATHQTTLQSGADIVKATQAGITLGSLLLESAKQSGASFLTMGSYWQFAGGVRKSTVFYAATKNAFSQIVNYYRDSHGVLTSEIILYDVYGPRDQRDKLLPQLLRATSTGEPITLRKPDALINLTFVSDAVDAIVQASSNPNAPAQFSIRNDRFIRIDELVTLVETISGKSINHEYSEERTTSLMLDPWIIGEILPSWKPQISLEEGLVICLGALP